jgi:hypothetical protein
MSEEVFNILSHNGNANQKYTDIPSHNSQNSSHQEEKTQNVDEDVRKKKPSNVFGENVN